MPDFKALTQDPRYTGLPWSQKQEVIRRFSEDNPSPNAPIAEEFERLKHYSADGTPQSKQFHNNLFAARESQYKAMLKGDDPAVAAKKYSEAANVAKSIYADSVTRRQEDLGLATELADMNSRTGVSFGNTLAAVFDSPRMFADSVTGELTPRQKGIEEAQARQKEIIAELTGRGYDEKAVSLLLQDASLATGATNGAPAAVDSQGHVVVNDGALVMDIEKVRTAIKELDAPDFSKEETLNRLELRQRAVIEQVFDSAEKGNGVTYDVDDRGVKSNPKISPVTSFGSVVSAVGSSFASLATGKPSQIQKRFFSSLQIGGGSQFDFDQKAEAVKQFVTDRDDALDRARIGLETGLLVDTANMVLTPFELAGSDVAGDAASFLAATGASTSPADRLANISKTAEFTELALRVIGQAAITRKVGTGTMAATGSSKLAAVFAIGYGSQLSATFNAREVLDSGGSDSEALVAGILGFGTTFALASGFNAIGAGGLEQFRSKASAAANVAKQDLLKRLTAANGADIVIKGGSRAANVAKGGIGEGVEEFVDEFINGLITQKYTGASADQLAENALKAALIGSGIGAVSSAFGPVSPDVTIKEINLDTPDSTVKAAADKAMADLSQAPDGTTTIDVEATDTTDQFAAAARVTELREKADTEDGLTDPEIEELQRLENQLDPNTPPIAAPVSTPTIEAEAPAPAALTPELALSLAQEVDLPVIGVGGNATVYATSNPDYVLRVSNRADRSSNEPFVLVEDRFPGMNFGQPVAERSGAQILRRQAGVPAGLDPLVAKTAAPESRLEAKSKNYAESIKRAAAMPQSAFDQFAAALKYLAGVGGKKAQFDPSKANNVLIDEEAGVFNLVDINDSPSGYVSDVNDILVTLMDNGNASYYRNQPGLSEAYGAIFDKAMAAAQKVGLDMNLDSSGKFSAALARRGAPSPAQDTTPVADEVPAKDPFVEEESVEEAPAPVFQVDDAGDVSPVEETEEEVSPPDPITEDDNVDELRDSLFDTLNSMSDSDLTVEQQAEFDSRINDAATPAEMSAIEQELLDIYTEKNAPKPKSKTKTKSKAKKPKATAASTSSGVTEQQADEEILKPYKNYGEALEAGVPALEAWQRTELRNAETNDAYVAKYEAELETRKATAAKIEEELAALKKSRATKDKSMKAAAKKQDFNAAEELKRKIASVDFEIKEAEEALSRADVEYYTEQAKFFRDIAEGNRMMAKYIGRDIDAIRSGKSESSAEEAPVNKTSPPPVQEEIVEEGTQVEETEEPYVDPVSEFLKRATPYQKQEYIRRALEGEDMVDILETIDTPDAAELLTEEEILAGVTPEDSESKSDDEGDTDAEGEPVVLYSFIFPDPQLIIKTAQDLYKGVKTLPVFAKRMITALGNRVRPIIRSLFHDLRRNKGVITQAAAPDPASTDAEPEQAALDAALDAQLESESPTPSEGLPSDRIDVPKGTTRADMDKMADQLTGSQNLLIPFIGKGLQYLSLGITKQVRSQITGEFFQRPYLSWLFERELAKRRSAFIANQFVLRYGKELGVNKDGTLKNVTARDPESSLHPSDVIEAVMDPARRNEYVVSDDFLKMVADWTSVRNQILKHASDAGIDLKFLKDEDGNFDNTKILENFYFPRGTVMLTESPEDSAGGVGSSRPKSKVKSFSFGRTFESEKVAVDSGKYQYPDTPAQRIQNFAEDVYGRIADRNFATHPDMIRASEKPRFAKNEEGKNVKLKPLGKSVINLAGTSLTFNNSKINILNSLIDGGRLNPDDAFAKAAKVAQFVRSIKFTFDASVAAVQLVYLWGTNPVRHGRAMGIALATTFGNKSWLENYTREKRDIISEYVSVGGLYDKTFEDADFLRTTDATHTRARKVLAKLFSPFTTLHATAINVGAVEMYSILRYQALDPASATATLPNGNPDMRTATKVDPIKAEKLARFADRTVGRESLTRNGLRASSRSALSMISSAPSMYAAFINLMADTVSKDKFTRNNALKGHGRFLLTMSVMYVAQAFASMMVDDEDEREPEDKIMDALSRLNPASKKFMVIEAPIGEGRRVVFSQGGFFKAALQVSTRVTTDPRNAASHIAQFLKSRKSPGVGTVLEIATGEDYFGNEITTLESLTDAMLPISLATVAQKYKGPALDVVGGWLGMKGQSTTSLLEEKPYLSQTLEQMIFSVAGFSSYTESSRAEFNRKIDRLSDKEFGADYKDLDFKQKAAVIKKAEDNGIVKPVLKTATSYSQFVIEKMDKELRDTTLRRELVTREAYQEFAAIPRYSVKAGRKVSVPIESSDHKRMYSAYVKSMVEFAKTPEMKDLTKKQVLKRAELEWENQLRANGY